ncbi:MAG: dephospho-CoA kinase [Candidatus Euphemobacter frigidus]|nr:dephospho-CoA kinase [Candidatus Euphemobacter frigidus]
MAKKYLRIGLTGGFGTGKSTVAGIFQELGAYVVDADLLARARLRKGTGEYRQVVASFGEKILNKDGAINRRALAAEVFGRPESLRRLNRIIHPGVIKEVKEGLDRAREMVRIAVIPLLFEVGLEDGFDYVVVVAADRDNVRRRLSAGRKMSPEEIDRRLEAQLLLTEKVRKANFVIDNNGPRSITRQQVEMLWKTLSGCLSDT